MTHMTQQLVEAVLAYSVFQTERCDWPGRSMMQGAGVGWRSCGLASGVYISSLRRVGNL